MVVDLLCIVAPTICVVLVLLFSTLCRLVLQLI